MLLNLVARPTPIIVESVEIEVPWSHPGGFVRDIDSIVKEFNEAWGLKCNRIAVVGPPSSGLTFLAQLIAKQYRLPVLRLSPLVEQAKAEDSELAAEVVAVWEECQKQAVEEEQKAFEEAKKKKKPKKGEPVEEFDPAKVRVRLPDAILAKIIVNRLARSDCQNKGFILDGFPKTQELADIIFAETKCDYVFSISLKEE